MAADPDRDATARRTAQLDQVFAATEALAAQTARFMRELEQKLRPDGTPTSLDLINARTASLELTKIWLQSVLMAAVLRKPDTQ